MTIPKTNWPLLLALCAVGIAGWIWVVYWAANHPSLIRAFSQFLAFFYAAVLLIVWVPEVYFKRRVNE
jgi:hypothetical protein